MAPIYFVRHGQTDWNAEGRFQGTMDIPLNARGRGQALRNGELLLKLVGDAGQFDFVSSPLMRATQTMEIIREAMGLPPGSYRTDGRLREVSMGAWEGMTKEEILRSHPENYARRQADIWRVAPPRGESYCDLTSRIAEWLSEVRTATIMVSHAIVSRCLRGYLLKLSPEQTHRLDVPQDKVLMIEGETLTWL